MTPTALARTHPRAAALAGATLLFAALLVPVQRSVVDSYAAPAVTVNLTGDAADAVLDGTCDTDLGTAGEQCTLRAAIEEANGGALVDTIEFAIGSGPVTITPLTPLPTITLPVTIDGWSQPPWTPGDDPLVAIDGAAVLASPLLDIDAGSSTVQGLVLHDGGAGAIDLEAAGGNSILGNWIGVLPDGTTAAGPGGDGIRIGPASTGNTIGGPGPDDGNVMVNAGGNGVHVLSDDNELLGNTIGTSPDGTTAMGNTGDGVRIDGATTTLVQDGSIANSGGNGVTVVNGGDDAAVVGTTISANTGLAIDLGDDGVTANDPGDLDGDENGKLNHPTVDDTGVASVDVTLDTDITAGSDVRIEVFRSVTGADPEADELIGTATVTSTGAVATFTVTTSQLAAGDRLRTTATEVVGAGFGATSELSPAATVTLAVVNSSGDAVDTVPADGICATGATNVDGDPECTLRAALDSAAASAVDGVAFAVPAGDANNVAGVVTITPTGDLPAVVVDLDGTTQTDFATTPLVAIDGAAATGPVLDVTTADVTVTSLSVLGGASHGIAVTADDVTVTDTWVGLAPDAATVDGPAGDGVRVDTAVGVRIDGGRIRGAGGNGVTVVGLTADDVGVTDTTISGSTGIGIDLGDDGPTGNDPGDVDGGPNGQLNAPEPTIATPDEVLFDLDVPIAGDYRIELFRNPAASGQGEELVTTTTISHAGAGTESFTLSGLTGISEDDELTLLATESIGGVVGSTSEFSATILADDDHADVNSTADLGDDSAGDGICSTGGTVGSDPECTLRAALEEAAATSRIGAVRFAVPPGDSGNVGGIVTISPASDLPSVAGGLLIDGTTQTGFATGPIVAIDGGGVTGAVLDVAAAGVSVQALALHGGPSHGLTVTGDDLTVIDTWVGVRPDGSDDGNTGDGVRVDSATTVLFDGGRIRDNGGTGLAVLGTADDVAVVDTTVAGNGGLGIDLGNDGVTPNDGGDPDGGPNERLNRPVVSAMSEAAGTVTLDVDLDVPAASVLLQVFTTPTRDPSGAGEGTALVHSQVVAGGAATRTVSFAGDLTQSFTATVTEEAAGSYGSTSEFSDTATLPEAAPDPGLVPETVAAAGALSSWRLGAEEGTTTATDVGTLGNDGTTAGGATFGAAGVTVADGDTAIDLDGTDGVVVVPHDPGYLLAEGAVSVWVELDALAGVQTVVSKDATGAGDGGHAALRVLADGTVEYEQGTTSSTVVLASAPGTVGSGAWHHLAATFGSRGVELWVDGARVDADDTWTAGWDSSAGGTTGNTEPITLGASQRSSTAGTADVLDRYVDGRLDEVALFGTQVSGATIAAIAGAAPQGTYATTTGVLLSVPVGQGVLVNDHDTDGEALTATLVTPPASAASFALVGDGSFTYTSTAGFTGTDTFTYTVTDGIGTSTAATATITVLPAQGDPVVTDSSGNGRTGRARGDMTSGDEVAGKIGTALDVDGADDRIVVPNLDVAGSELTLSAWLDVDALGTDPVVLAKAVGVTDGDTEWRLRLDDTAAISGNLEGGVRTSGGLVDVADPGLTNVADGWVHVAVRADGTTLTLFVDGSVVATAAQTGSLQVDPRIETGIGGVASGGAAFDGRIDETRVSSTARSDAWLAAEHATQDDPAAAVTVGSTQTSAPSGWTTSTAQARSGTSSALAPSGVLRSWLTLDGVAETGLEARAWWRVNQLTGLDLGQGVRAGDAAGVGPVQQDETGLAGAAGWDLGQVFGPRTQLEAPPAAQTPTVDTWQRVVVRIDQTDGLTAVADGVDIPTAGAALAGVAPTGTFGLRVEDLDPAVRWWVDDVAIRRYVTPEPVATVRRTEQAP